MLKLPNYASALRCIGQALQKREIEVFDLQRYPDELRLQAGDPNPPYTALIDLSFTGESIEILDREGEARRGQSGADVRFDSIPEILRAVGEYLDRKRGDQLRRITNSCHSINGLSAIEIEYQTRAGDVQTEILTASAIRDASVNMYKRRTHLSNPVNMLTGRR
jgi:hypothetical protein